ATNTATVGVFLNSLGSRDLAATIAANGTGDVTLFTDADVELTSVTTASGDIAVTADGGDVDATLVTAGTAGDVTITTNDSGSIIAGQLTAAGDEVTLTAAGAIVESAGNDDIEALIIDIDGATEVGSGAAPLVVDQDAGGQVEIDSVVGDMWITSAETDQLTVDINQAIANVTPGALNLSTTAAANIDIDSGNAAVGSNLVLGTISAFAGANNVTISSFDNVAGAGNILDGNDGQSNVIASVLTIDDAAGTGVTDNPLDTTIATLNMSNITGATFMQEDDAIDLLAVTVDGDFTLETVDGTITATDVNTADDTVTLTSSDAITVANFGINTDGAGTGGDVDLTAGSTIALGFFGIDADVATVTLAAVGNVTGGGGLGLNISAGRLNITDAANVGTALSLANALVTNIDTLDARNVDGNVFIFDTGDFTAEYVQAGDDVALNANGTHLTIGRVIAQGNVTLTAGENIIDGDAGQDQGTVDIEAGGLTIGVAGLGPIDNVGTVANPLETRVAALRVEDGRLSAATTTGLYLSNEGDLTLDYATNVGTVGQIDTFVVTTSGSLTIDGGVNLIGNDADVITLTSTGGDLTIDAVGDPVQVAGPGTITLTSADDLHLDSDIVTGGTGTVVLSAGAAITDDDDAGSEITTGTLTIRDATTIGSSAVWLDTNVTTLNVRSASVAGDPVVSGASYILEEGDIDLNVVTTEGAFTLTAAGAVTATSVSATNNDISLIGGTTVALDTVTAGTGDVSITASAGAITDISGAEGANVTGSAVTLSADGNIGVAGVGDIDTAATALDVSVEDVAGNIVIEEANDVELRALDTFNGDITVTLQSGDAEIGTIYAGTDTLGNVVLDVDQLPGQDVTDLDDNSAVTADDLTISASGNIGTSELLAINTTTGEYLSIDSITDGDIYMSESNDLTATAVDAADGAIWLSAGGALVATHIDADDAGGNEDHDVTLLTTDDGAVTLTSVEADDDVTVTTSSLPGDAGDIQVGLVSSSSNGSGNDITLTASAGAITDVDTDAAADLVTAGGRVTLTAYDEIGAAGNADIDITAAEIVAAGTNSGAIVIQETDGADFVSVTTTDGLIDLTAAADSTATLVSAAGSANDDGVTITLTAGDLEVDVISAAGLGDVVVTTNTVANQDILDAVGDDSVISGDNVELTAWGNIGTVGADIGTAATTLDVTSANTGAIVITEADDVTLTAIDTADGLITIAAGGNMIATSVVAGGNARNVTLSTTNGGNVTANLITAADDQVTVNAAGGILGDAAADGNDITATTIDLDAVTQIGATNAITTAGTTITAATTGVDAASIDLDNTIAATVTLSTEGATANITFDNTGDLTVSGAAAQGGGTIQITANEDVAVEGQIVTVDAGTITLTADTDTNNDGDVNIGFTTGATISSRDGDISITGENILMGDDVADVASISTTGVGDVDLNAVTAFTMQDSANGVIVVSSGGVIDIDPQTVTIASGGLRATGAVTINATDRITINGVVESETSSVALTITDDPGALETVTINDHLVGDDVTVTVGGAADALIEVTAAITNTEGGFDLNAVGGLIDIGDGAGTDTLTGTDDITMDAANINIDASVVTVNAGDIDLHATAVLDINAALSAADAVDLDGDTTLTLAANVTGANDVNVNDIVTIDGNGVVVQSISGDVTFAAAVQSDATGNDRDVTVKAVSGEVDFQGAVATAGQLLRDLTVDARTMKLTNGTITVQRNADFTDTEFVLIDANTVITSNAGNVLFSANGDLDSVDGDETLQVVAALNIELGTIGDEKPVESLDVDAATTAILHSDITVDGAIDFADTADIDLSGDVSISSVAAGTDADILLTSANGALDGAYDLTITNVNGDVTVDADVGANEAIETLTVNVLGADDDFNLQGNGSVNVVGAVDVTAGQDINLANTVVSTTGSQSFDAGRDLSITAGGLTAAQNITGVADEAVTIGATVLGQGRVEFTANAGTADNNEADDTLSVDANVSGGQVVFHLADGSATDTAGEDILLNFNLDNSVDGGSYRFVSENADQDVILEGAARTLTTDHGDVVFETSIVDDGTASSFAIAAGAGDVSLRTVTVTGTGGVGLDVNSTGTTFLEGNITATDSSVDFSGASWVEITNHINIDTTGGVDNPGNAGADILFGIDAGTDPTPLNTLTGNYGLWLDAGDGDIVFDNVNGLVGNDDDTHPAGLIIAELADQPTPSDIGANDVTFKGVTVIPGGSVIYADTVTGSNPVIADEDILWEAGRINVDDTLAVSGNHTITLTATGDGVGAADGDILVGTVVSSQFGKITLSADDDVVFDGGNIYSLGEVDITANSGNNEANRGIIDENTVADDPLAKITGNVVTLSVQDGYIGEGTNFGTAANAGAAFSAPVEATGVGYLDIDVRERLDVTLSGGGTVPADSNINVRDMIGDFPIGAVNANAGDADVNMIAAGGGVTDANGAVVNVIAENVVVTALGQIDLDTTIDTLNASGIGAGDINIVNTQALTLTDVDTVAGDIDVTTTAGALTVTDVDTVDDNINLTAATAVTLDTVGAINAGLGTVRLTAQAGDITSTVADDNTAEITASGIYLTAIGGRIGGAAAANALDVTTTGSHIQASTTGNNNPVVIDNISVQDTTLVATTTGTTSNITAQQRGGGDLEVILAQTADGTITVNVDSADLTATEVTAGGTGNIDFNTTTAVGNINLGVVTADSSTVTISAFGASTISDANGENVNITATTLNIDDAGSVGAQDNMVNTDIATLNMSNIDGATFITEADDINLNAVDVDGDFTLSSVAGTITATNVDTSDDIVTLIAGEDIAVQFFGINTDGPGAGTGGDVNLTADDAITIGVLGIEAVDATVTMAAGGNITGGAALNITAGRLNVTDAANVGTALTIANALVTDIGILDARNVDGDVYIYDTASFTAEYVQAGDDVGLNANGTDLTIGRIIAQGNVTLSAGRNILDGDALMDTVTVDIEAGGLTLGVTGLGPIDNVGTVANPLETNVSVLRIEDGRLAAAATTGLYVVNEGDLELDYGTNIGTDGQIDTFSLTTGGSLTVDGGLNMVGSDADVITLTSTGGDVVIDATGAAVEVAGNGTITLDAADDMSLLSDVATGATGNVVLTAGAAITDDGDVDTEITTGTLTIRDAASVGSSTVPLDTNVTTLNVRGAANEPVIDGPSYILEEGDIDLNVVATEGAFNLTAGGAITATSVTTTDSDVSLTATNSVAVDTVNAGTGDVDVTALGGAITDISAGEVAANVTGAAVTLTAAGTIGTGAVDFDTAADSLDVSATVAAGIEIEEADGVNLLDVDTADGSITIRTGATANGDVTITDVQSTTDAEANDITITVGVGANTGDVEMGTITIGAGAAQGTAGDVVLDVNGAIDDMDDNSLINAQNLSIDAEGGIGDSDLLAVNTWVENLLSVLSTDGAIYLNETDALTVTELDTDGATGGSIWLQAGGTITQVDGNDIVAAGTSDVTITTTAGNVSIADVQAAGDTVTITSAGTIIETNATDGDTDITADAVVLSAVNQIGNADAAETADATADLDISAITVSATTTADNAFINFDVNKGAATASSVSAITAGTAGNVRIDQTDGGALTVTSATTTDGTLDVSVTAGGALTVDAATIGGAGRDIDLDTVGGGNITLGALTTAANASAADVIVDSSAAILDDDLQSTIVRADDLDFDAQGAIGATGSGDIDTDAVTAELSALAAGGIYVTEVDGITLDDVDTLNGNIVVTAGGDMIATDVIAGAAGAGDGNVTLRTLEAGNITIDAVIAQDDTVTIDAFGSLNDDAAADGLDIQAATVDLDAGTGIGATTAVELEATALSADSASGNIDIDSTAVTGVTVTTLTTGIGTITLDQTGNQTLAIDYSETVKGGITVNNTGADLTVTEMTAGGDLANISLATITTGSVLIDRIAAEEDSVTITAAAAGTGSIEESAVDAAADIIAGTIDLDAPNGIGALNSIEMVGGTTIDADTTAAAAHIALSNVSDRDTTLQAISTTGADANITIAQAGSGTLNAASAITTTDGDIAITSADSDIQLTTVTAGTDGNINVTSTIASISQAAGTIQAVDGGVALTAGQDVSVVAVDANANTMSGNTVAIKINADRTVTVAAGSTGLVAVDGTEELNIDIDPIDIAINSAVTANGNVTGTASNNILVAAGVTVTADQDSDGAGNVQFTADDDLSGSGRFAMGAGSTLTGENLTITAHDVTADSLTADRDGSGNGTVTVTAANDATFNNAVLAGNLIGTIDITATEQDVVTGAAGTLIAGSTVDITSGDNTTLAANVQSLHDGI
ncbi:MAG: hypothetical protein HON70_32980, partial [Lentisphaerae bacterium]|nr:hypothetical protein [Lentisphaerota bacterium]